LFLSIVKDYERFNSERASRLRAEQEREKKEALEAEM
jgi:hypothetical protein